MSRSLANLLLLTAGAIWGMGFVAQQTAMDDIDALLFIALRFIIAGIAVTPFAIMELRKSGSTNYTKTLMPYSKWFFLVGLTFFLGMLFQQIGLKYTTVTNAGFLTALYVVFVPILMLLVLRKAPQPIIWPAALLALAGIYMLSGNNFSSLNKGDLLVILSAVFWATHIILTGLVGQISKLPVSMACCQFYVCAFLAAICYGVLLATGYSTLPSQEQLMAAMPEVLYAGIIAGGLGFTLQAIGQRYTSESTAAILISTESLFAAMFGAIFLSEKLGGIGYVGCALIFIAVLMVELMPQRKKSAKAS